MQAEFSNRERFISYVLERPRLVIAFWVIFLLLCGISATRLELREDILDVLPRDDEIIQDYLTVSIDSNRQNTLLIDIAPVDTASRSDLIQFGDRLVERMRQSDHFESIQYEFTIDRLNDLLEDVELRRHNLFTPADSAALDTLLTPVSIRDRVAELEQQLAESPAPFIYQSFKTDPFGINNIFLRKYQQLSTRSEGAKVEQNRLWTRENNHLLIIAKPRYKDMSGTDAYQMVEYMEQIEQELAAEGEDKPKVQIHWISGHRFAHENENIIKDDLRIAVLVSIIAISILALLVFRSPLLVLLTLIPAGVGVVFSLGIMGVLKSEIAAVSLGASTILIGISVDYGIHLLYHFDRLKNSQGNRAAILQVLMFASPSVVLSAGTTMLALLTLLFSAFPGYKELGIITVFGILGAASFSLTGLLVLVTHMPGSWWRKRPLLNLEALMGKVWQQIGRKRSIGLTVFALISVISLIGLFRLQFDGDLTNLSATSSDLQYDLEQITSSFHLDKTTITIGLENEVLENLFEEYNELHELIGDWQAQGKIYQLESLSPVFPSITTQKQNSGRWQNYWSSQRIASARNNVDLVCDEIDIRPEIFNQYLSQFEAMPTLPTTIDPILDEDNPLHAIITPLLLEQSNGWVGLLNIRLKNQEDIVEFRKSVLLIAPEAIIYDGSNLIRHVIDLISSEMRYLGGMALLFVILLLTVVVRNVKRVLLKVIALLSAILWTFGLMGIFGIKFNLMNSIVVVFVFGLVVDYIIFLTRALDVDLDGKHNHLAQSLGAILVSSLTTIFAFSALALAQHPAFHYLGLTAVVGIASGLLAVLLLTRLFGKVGD